MGFQRRTTVAFLACFSSHIFPVLSASSLLDSAGRLLTAPSSTSTDQGVVALISSPATPSKILPEASDALSLEDEGTCTLLCSGATLSGMASEQQLGLAACGYLADAVVCDGIVAGDIESGFRNSRHSRTLTAIFRARLQAEEVPKQTLVMCVSGTDDGKTLEGEIKFLYKAVADEKRGARAFSDAYEVKVVDVGSGGESSQVSRIVHCFITAYFLISSRDVRPSRLLKRQPKKLPRAQSLSTALFQTPWTNSGSLGWPRLLWTHHI